MTQAPVKKLSDIALKNINFPPGLVELEKYCFEHFIELVKIAQWTGIEYSRCYKVIYDLEAPEADLTRLAILSGESRRKESETKTYELYARLYRQKEPLLKRAPGGIESQIPVDERLMSMVHTSYNAYIARFEKASFTRRLERKIEALQGPKTGEDVYYLLQREFLERADAQAGLTGRKTGDLSFRPGHLKIEAQAGTEMATALPAEYRSSVLWTPEHDPRAKPKKLIL